MLKQKISSKAQVAYENRGSVPGVELASPSLLRIFAAMGYDSLLLAALSLVYGALVVGLHVALWGAPAPGQHIHWSPLAALAICLGWLGLLLGFYQYFWVKFGQTLGMKTWHIQLVQAHNHQRVTPIQALARSVIALMCLLLLGVGFWYRFMNPRQQLLQDVLTGTRLILLKPSKGRH